MATSRSAPPLDVSLSARLASKNLPFQDANESAPSSTPTDADRSSSVSSKSGQCKPTVGKTTLVSFWHGVFKEYGTFLASQPWEVIIVSVVVLISILTYCQSQVKRETSLSEENSCPVNYMSSASGREDMGSLYQQSIALIVLGSIGMIHLMVNLKKISHLGTVVFYISNSYILMIFMLYSLLVWTVGGPDKQIMQDAWLFVPLLNDLPKVAQMAQMALASSHSRRINENIGHAMSLMGPIFTWNTLDKIMFFSFGFYWIPSVLNHYAWFAVVSAIANFAIFFTFYPAGLAILIDLWLLHDNRLKWNIHHMKSKFASEEKIVPAVKNFRILVTFSMFCAHILTVPSLLLEVSDPITVDGLSSFALYIKQNPDRIICLTGALALVVLHWSTNHDEPQFHQPMARKGQKNNLSNDFKGGQCKVATYPANVSLPDEGIASSSSLHPQIVTKCAASDDSSSEWSVDITVPALTNNSEGEMLPHLCMVDEETQTGETIAENESDNTPSSEPRSLDECRRILLNTLEDTASSLSDEEVAMLLESKDIKMHNLEKVLNDNLRAVKLRRKVIEQSQRCSLDGLPFSSYEYKNVMGACCESVIGYMTLPVGLAGPLVLDGQSFMVPMATTEGCLVASVNRGCRALNNGGVTSQVTGDGMTRSPILR
jgi:hypothetical protein